MTSFHGGGIHGVAASGNLEELKKHIAKASARPLFSSRNAASNFNVDAQDSNGMTILAVAASRGHLECVQHLMEKLTPKPNLLIQDIIGWSALHHAACEAHLEVVGYLIEKGGIELVGIKTKQGETGLHTLIKAAFAPSKPEYESIISRLARAPGILTVKTESGESPLYAAVNDGVEKAVICLLDAKANPNVQHSHSGETPLHAAVRAAAAEPRKMRILTLLLNNGAKTTIADNNGVTPQDLASQLNATALIDILKAHVETELTRSGRGLMTKRPQETQQQQQGLDNMYSQLRSTIKVQKQISKRGLSAEIGIARGPPARAPPPKPVESTNKEADIVSPIVSKAPFLRQQPASAVNNMPAPLEPKRTQSEVSSVKLPEKIELRTRAGVIPFKPPQAVPQVQSVQPAQPAQSAQPTQPAPTAPQPAQPTQPAPQSPQPQSAQIHSQSQVQINVQASQPTPVSPPASKMFKQPSTSQSSLKPVSQPPQQSGSKLARPRRPPNKKENKTVVLNTLRSQAAYIPSTLIDMLASEDVSDQKSDRDFVLDGQKVKIHEPISQPDPQEEVTPRVFKGAIQVWKPVFILQIPFTVKENKEVDKIRKMFEAEVRTMTESGVLHPSLISYLGCEVIQKLSSPLSGFVNVVTESTGESGTSMKELLVKEKVFSEKFSANVLSRILEALSFLHKRKIVHRSLQLENVLVDSNGKVKLTDYLASNKIVMLESQKRKAEADGDGWAEPVTSPHHTAPEALKDYTFTTYSDVWSVGACLLEMLTGKTPFWEYEGVAAALQAIDCEEPPIPKATVATFSKECVDFILPCFSCLPTDRPPVRSLISSKFISSNLISDEDIFSVLNTVKENNENRISEQEIRANQKQLDEGLKWLAGALDSGHSKQATRFSKYVEDLLRKIDANPKLKDVESLRFLVQYANELIKKHHDAVTARIGARSAPASTVSAASFVSRETVGLRASAEEEDEEDDDADEDNDEDENGDSFSDEIEDDLDIQWD